MSTHSDFNRQLGDLAVQLSGMVAERLAHWSKDMSPNERRRILDMIEGQLPNIIANSISKTPSLHNAAGVDYFQQNLENYADAYAKKFLGKD
jgi:hypothetical protein